MGALVSFAGLYDGAQSQPLGRTDSQWTGPIAEAEHVAVHLQVVRPPGVTLVPAVMVARPVTLVPGVMVARPVTLVRRVMAEARRGLVAGLLVEALPVRTARLLGVGHAWLQSRSGSRSRRFLRV